MTWKFDSLMYLTLGLSWIENLQSYLGIAATIVAILSGTISIIIKLIDALKDGHLDDDELIDIGADIENLLEKAKETNDDRNRNTQDSSK